jgi:ssRNA-specific RNase YbeY (16S rRNA maturation enzyme)
MIKQFMLGATKWDVEEVECFEDSTKMGDSLLGQTRIRVSKTWEGEKTSKQSKEATLYHEVVHSILDTLGYEEISRDEILVQGLATLMQQFEQTKN